MNQFEEWIIQNHEMKWNARIERLMWLQEHTPQFEHGFLFRGGQMGLQLWEEARYCFVEGQYLATTILSLSFIEYQLSGIMYGAGVDEAEDYTAFKTIDKAYKMQLITSEERDLLHKVRKRRNPIAHFQSPLDEYTLSRRAVSENSQPEKILEGDAEDALMAVFSVIKRLGIGDKLDVGIPPEHHPDQTSIDQFE